ncbi:MAG: DUF2061 domain-containing protein [Candidatus Lokiarchaeota archaeon]|nr:DUF2061 domain-containing protein [Candidatus Lokiarchaeota archaeon]
MKQKEKSIKWRENLKESLLKSIIYRIITITLGILVVYIITGSLVAALSLGLITESVQFINYFVYESVWTNFHDKRLKRRIEEMREVDVKFDFDLIKDLSYEFSQTNTFVKEHYNSILKLLDNLLKNNYLDEIHDVILRDKTYFEIKHKDRTFHKL